MLHTMNGFLMAAIGIAMVNILNRSRKFKVRLSPAFVALVAFCFSMTVGVVWGSSSSTAWTSFSTRTCRRTPG